MKRYPIGIQDFSELRNGGFVYVDKTRQIFDLVQRGKYYFLSRPRRFGKSLLLSTLKYLFLGRRELFHGLWVDKESGYAWGSHPVIHFSFSSSGYKEIGLEQALLRLVDQAAAEYHIPLTSMGLSARFREFIHTLGSGTEKVVLLIDEYDKPLTDYLEDLPQAEANRETLKTFFSVLKDADPFLRFILITGVSKFSKVSLFSDLNNLNDLTRHPRYATLTGYTPEELDHYFGEDIPALAEANQLGVDEVKSRIQLWYNGYQWEPGQPVYNPFSVLRLFEAQRFRNYWWETGTPTLLLRALRQDFKFDLSDLRFGASLFDSYTLDNLDWRNLLFQTGYLTIKEYLEGLDVYVLDYPNHEVKASMSEYLMATFRHSSVADTQPLFADLKLAFDEGNMPKLVDTINLIFSTIPYQIFDERREGFFHAILHIAFLGVGLLTESEVSRSNGRVDCVVKSKSAVYIIEFKLDDTAEAALEQIRTRRYGASFLGNSLPVIALGIGFSSATRSVADWKSTDYLSLNTKA